MEYEVHTQLMNKLKLRGMNALFGLRIQITVGENMLMGLAVSTVLILGFFCFLNSIFSGHKDIQVLWNSEQLEILKCHFKNK